MKLEKLSATAELVSSIAIVVTLVYLTVEVRQNTEALNAQSRQSVLTSAQTELFVSLEHPELVMALAKPEPLTTEENIEVDAFLTAALRAREFSWLQFRSRLIDEAQWNTELAVIRSIMSSPHARLWWNRLGRTYVSAEFSEFLDGVIGDQPAANNDWETITVWSEP